MRRSLHLAVAGILGLQVASSAQATFTITIDPGAYAGQYSVAGEPFRTGGYSTSLAPGTYGVSVGSFAGFSFRVAGDGAVSIDHNAEAATASDNTVTFRNTLVQIDPVAFAGQWHISAVTGWVTGAATLVLVPSGVYGMSTGSFAGFSFRVAGDGAVSIDHNAEAATASDNTVTFRNTLVQIDPVAFAGQWHISAVTGWVTGAATLVLVPSGMYGMSVGPWGGFQFDVSAGGTVSLPGGGSAGTASGGTLTLNNTAIRIDPGNYSGPWVIDGVHGPASGFHTVTLVPDIRYNLTANNAGQQFGVAHPCAVDPPVISTGGATFTLSCGAADSDNDGVPDTSDNCPLVANPDQLDLDGDSVGDACDSDRDNDGVSNEVDNCPGFPNPDQADLDEDGVGDACDDDVDGDSVVDAQDNCPLTRNPDQADSDGDQIGDVCDPDNDNDGVPNALDNCPLTANPSQADFDGDGQGDACDNDVDGDGVANAGDVCALTPRDQPVNAEGCSGAQFIARSCILSNFVQHGQYVSCVAEAANTAAAQGLIRPTDKARFVSDAATKKK
ncbi:MAG: thrombospondin type 3 repeat-containing protein [Acidobacteriota bacterium]